jgi:RimJ/RimL family protein N-acetyltransferase
VSLRELRQRDAPALLKHLAHESVLTYVAGAPQSLDGLRRFIRWCRAQRQAATHLTFGVVAAGQPEAIGLVQIWPIERDFSTAEWGFVIGEAYQGSGIFTAAAALLLDFAFRSLGVMRLEARAVVEDGRSNRALRKLGATCEGRLRCGFRSSDVILDHAMWSILAPEWPARQADHWTRGGADRQ